MNNNINVYTIDVPEYNSKMEPDFESIGAKIDVLIKKICLDEEVVIRTIIST